jgi:hypothetical protein
LSTSARRLAGVPPPGEVTGGVGAVGDGGGDLEPLEGGEEGGGETVGAPGEALRGAAAASREGELPEAVRGSERGPLGRGG